MRLEIEMGSDEIHFNVSLSLIKKATKTVSTDHLFSREKVPKRNRTVRPNLLPESSRRLPLLMLLYVHRDYTDYMGSEDSSVVR